MRCSTAGSLPGCYAVAEDDDPAGEDVGAQAAAVDEAAQRSGRRHPLQPRARLCQPLAVARDLAHFEAPADQCVEIDAARDDVAPGVRGVQFDAVLLLERLDRLGLDQGQFLPAPARGREAAPPGG